jgi:hypothetical protein
MSTGTFEFDDRGRKLSSVLGAHRLASNLGEKEQRARNWYSWVGTAVEGLYIPDEFVGD